MIQAPKTFIQRLKYVGPSVIVVGSVVGSGELVLTSLLGAAAGFAFLWWVIFSTISKSIVQAEIARYVIVTKKTFLESFSEIPGPSTKIGQKKSSWAVWILLLGALPALAGGGGIIGSAAEAANILVPFFSPGWWVVILSLVTSGILFWGSYKSLEKVMLTIVIAFSAITLIISIAIQSTEYQVSFDQLAYGFSFDFPFEYLALALAVYGYTGINSGEIMAYSYWCLEKGYGKEADANKGNIKTWIKVMQTDVWATLFFMVLGTLPFFILGAAVLHPLDLYPPPNGDLISTLSNMFTEVLGSWAKWMFLIGGFFILFSTTLSGVAAQTRVLPDYLLVLGIIKEKKITRLSLTRAFACIVPIISGTIYFLFPNPVSLLLIAGIWAALVLPLINAVAIYLVSKLEPDLQPKLGIKVFLWVTLILLVLLALLVSYNVLIGF